ncbi:MAG: HEAT repeat domain-containing protein [Acidobacteriota bacterium]
MTAVIISSALIGALAAHPLLRWAQRKESFLNKLDSQCAVNLLLPALFIMALLVFILYTPAYTLIVIATAIAVAFVAAITAGAIHEERRRSDLSTLMVNVEKVKANRRSRWAVVFHSLLFVVIFSMLATEALLATAKVGSFLYLEPELHAFIVGERAAPTLMDSIRRGDSGGVAALSLIEMGKTEDLIGMGPKAVPALMAVFGWTDSDGWYYSTCCGYSTGKPAIKEGSARAEAIRALARIGEPAIPDLLRVLSGGSADKQYEAEEVLVQIGRSVIPHLRKRLPLDNTDAFRTRAIRILRRICDPSTAPDLIAALGDPHYAVRAEAALGLGQMKELSAASVLIDLLRDDSLMIRCIAARALGDIGDRRAVPALMAMLSSDDRDMREEASKAIEKIGDTLPSLIEGLKKGDVETRRLAASALARFRDDRAAPALIDSLKDTDAQVRRIAAEKLGETRNHSAVPALIAALSDVDSGVKTQAAQSLGLLGDPMAVGALLRELRKSDDSSWRYFADALIRVGDTSIAPDVIAALRKRVKNRWQDQRVAFTISSLNVAPFMVMALGDKDARVRHLAASVLAQIGDTEAIPALETAERKYHRPGFCPFCKALQDLKAR